MITATLTLRAALLMRPARCLSTDQSTPGVVMHLRDTSGMFYDTLTVMWMGQDATNFLSEHYDAMPAGRCLDLQINGLRAHGNELRARIQNCSLAPLAPSWKESLTTPVALANPVQAATKTIA